MSSPNLAERKRLRGVVTDAAPTARAVVLIGSFARGTAVRPISDLDVLIVTDDLRAANRDLHVVPMSADRLRERVLSGDDFAQWALRYGVPLSGRAWWEARRRELGAIAPWPAADRKFQLADERLKVIEDLFALGDSDATQYELRFAASLLARGLLLGAGIFPLSRPELPGQLNSIGCTWLAQLLQELAEPRPIEDGDLFAAIRKARSLTSEKLRKLDGGSVEGSTS
jgi:predicted nucleotidyltransferase